MEVHGFLESSHCNMVPGFMITLSKHFTAFQMMMVGLLVLNCVWLIGMFGNLLIL